MSHSAFGECTTRTGTAKARPARCSTAHDDRRDRWHHLARCGARPSGPRTSETPTATSSNSSPTDRYFRRVRVPSGCTEIAVTVVPTVRSITNVEPDRRVLKLTAVADLAGTMTDRIVAESPVAVEADGRGGQSLGDLGELPALDRIFLALVNSRRTGRKRFLVRDLQQHRLHRVAGLLRDHGARRRDGHLLAGRQMPHRLERLVVLRGGAVERHDQVRVLECKDRTLPRHARRGDVGEIVELGGRSESGADQLALGLVPGHRRARQYVVRVLALHPVAPLVVLVPGVSAVDQDRPAV